MRFTPLEVEQGKRLGLDTSRVKTKADLSAALIRWIGLVGEHRPEILEKLLDAARKDPVLRAKLPSGDLIELSLPTSPRGGADS